MLALSEDPSILGWTASRTPARGINRKYFSHACREKASFFPLLVWSRLKIHQMPTVMVDFRSCENWWQRNGEAVYCTHDTPLTLRAAQYVRRRMLTDAIGPAFGILVSSTS